MYAQPETNEALFQDIQINDLSPAQSGISRTGYLVSEQLQRQLTAANAPDRTASMNIWVFERYVNIGVRETDASTRRDLYLTVRYQFMRSELDGESKKPIVGTHTAVATYNVTRSPYAEITAQQDARERAAEEISERIARDIAFKIKS